MTTLPQQETIVQYVGNNSQTAFTFAFYCPLNTDIAVYLTPPNTPANPTADLQVLTVNYTVAFNVDPTTGGTVTFVATPATGSIITLLRNVSYSLTTNFAATQNFNGANLDAALQRLLLLIQQNQTYITQRNLSYLIDSYLPVPIPFTQLPKLGVNQVWLGTSGGVIAQTITVP